MRVALEVETRNARLDPAQRKRLGDIMVSNLRVSLVERRVVDAKSDLSRHEVEALVEQLDLARKDDPENARLEYWSAHLLMVGDFLDEAVEAIARFHQVAKGEHPLASRIERIQELVDEKKQHGKGKTRSGDARPARGFSRDDRDISAREVELELQPTSMQLYTELCHELALADRWRDAHAWSARALARCLTPAGQTRAASSRSSSSASRSSVPRIRARWRRTSRVRDRLDLCGGVSQFAAQPADVDVDRSGLHETVVSPDLLEQPVA